jgi:hypothetical protein
MERARFVDKEWINLERSVENEPFARAQCGINAPDFAEYSRGRT